ncbi:hypothetical protein [Streptomyces sp. NPDC002054]|uniref:hypothetical protein n=1 Tax=Streptomyces sp. NPDC002054 TaxID=3154663 RepID=UPI00332A134F
MDNEHKQLPVGEEEVEVAAPLLAEDRGDGVPAAFGGNQAGGHRGSRPEEHAVDGSGERPGCQKHPEGGGREHVAGDARGQDQAEQSA